MEQNKVFFAASFIYYYENGNINSFPQISCLTTISPNGSVDEADVEECFQEEEAFVAEEFILHIIGSGVLGISQENERSSRMTVWVLGKINDIPVIGKNIESLDFELLEKVIEFE